ncbi:MAG TPA: hypothetical protein VL285_18770 [Bryobacteraceae bacterium]|jgi:hypothetical protein|nr:hypothetical protein [Bryobacteraceae bacterium]
MSRRITFLALACFALFSCAKKENAVESRQSPDAPVADTPSIGPHAFVRLKNGSRVPGSVVASSQTDIVLAGDDGIERKIPLTQVAAIEYGEALPSRQTSREPSPPKKVVQKETPAPQTAPEAGQPVPPQTAQQVIPPTPAPPPTVVTTKTYELPPGREISVRTNELIDSSVASEGQTFDAQVTREVKDVDGDIVIPRGAGASIVIKSASKGGRFRGASDLVLDLKSVTINGKQYEIDTADISQKGKSGVGVNKRTAEYTGGGSAIGAIIGAIAGGGKGAAIGAGAGAGAGALTQILTKGGAIKVPAESVLTFNLDKPLKVTAVE